MQVSRPASALTSGLLAGAAVLHVLAAREHWGDVCYFGPDDSFDCIVRGDSSFLAIGLTNELTGVAMLVMAAAMAFVPAALGRRLTGFTRPVLSGAVLIQAVFGATILFSFDLPTASYLLWFFLLPALIGFAPLIPDGDDRRAGFRGGLVTWMLIGTTPLIQFMVSPMIGGVAVDASPWYEVMVAPFLLVAAAALAVGLLRQRAFSNQHLAHSLSL